MEVANYISLMSPSKTMTEGIHPTHCSLPVSVSTITDLTAMYLNCVLLAYLLPLIECNPLPSPSSDLLRNLDLSVDETGATAFSLLYGSPLVNFLQIAKSTLEYGGSNILFSHNTTATASTRTVVRPNVDTVYAEAIFDLSATDLVLTLPAMDEDRFYLAAFFDPSVIPSSLCSLLQQEHR